MQQTPAHLKQGLRDHPRLPMGPALIPCGHVSHLPPHAQTHRYDQIHHPQPLTLDDQLPELRALASVPASCCFSPEVEGTSCVFVFVIVFFLVGVGGWRGREDGAASCGRGEGWRVLDAVAGEVGAKLRDDDSLRWVEGRAGRGEVFALFGGFSGSVHGIGGELDGIEGMTNTKTATGVGGVELARVIPGGEKGVGFGLGGDTGLKATVAAAGDGVATETSVVGMRRYLRDGALVFELPLPEVVG